MTSPEPPRRRMNRRHLLQAGGVAAVVAAGGLGAAHLLDRDDGPIAHDTARPEQFSTPPAPATARPGGIPTRRLGRIDWQASVLSLGGAYLDGPDTVERALDQGMNVIDTAPSGVYGRSHEILAQVVPRRRDEVLLMSKVDARTRSGADDNLRDSLQRLKVDHLDVLMLHGLSYADEVDQVFAPGGAMETLLAAQRAGVVRHLGFSAHHSTAVAVRALERHDFDMVLAPVNPADHLIDDFTAALRPYARRRDMALVGMKALASGALPDVTTALQWAMSQPWHSITAGVSSVEHVETDVAAARDFVAMSPQRQADIVEQWRSYAQPSRYYWRQNLGRIG